MRGEEEEQKKDKEKEQKRRGERGQKKGRRANQKIGESAMKAQERAEEKNYMLDKGSPNVQIKEKKERRNT